MSTPRSKGVILPTLRGMAIGESATFPHERLGALRTASWYLAKYESTYYCVSKRSNGVYVKRNA